MPRIYCVEDDANIRELICYALKTNGFEVEGYECAADFFAGMESALPELILLDIMLPDMDGMEILAKLRAGGVTKDIPVIMLTAKSSEIDKVRGLDSGADDYITKPFGVMELISRVKAVLCRADVRMDDDILTIGDILIDRPKRMVTVAGTPVTLTYKEFELLSYLVRNKGIVLTRDKIMNEVWGFDFEGESRTVDVHIRTLRQKLGDNGKIIETVRNVGYRVG